MVVGGEHLFTNHTAAYIMMMGIVLRRQHHHLLILHLMAEKQITWWRHTKMSTNIWAAKVSNLHEMKVTTNVLELYKTILTVNMLIGNR